MGIFCLYFIWTYCTKQFYFSTNKTLSRRLKLLPTFVIMLIFLDIDGVMVPAKGWKSPELLEDGFPSFSVAATQVLQKIMSEQTALVLTSSHKSNYTLEEWKNIFLRRGIVVHRLKSLDKNVNHLNRKDEVLNWFANHLADENFVILDDDKSLNSLPSHLKDHLVLTSSLIGLSQEHLVQIEAVLKMDVQVEHA